MARDAKPVLYTLGHSNYPTLAQLEHVLPYKSIKIIDVRSHPGSSANPQFGRESLQQYFGPRYQVMHGLGGWMLYDTLDIQLVKRMARHDVDILPYGVVKFPKHVIAKECNHKWNNRGLYDYAWYTSTKRFIRAMGELLGRVLDGESLAIMCAELLWWRCHRSMIADVAAHWEGVHRTGLQIIHLQPRPTLHDWRSKMVQNRIQRYPALVQAHWEGISA